METLIKEIIETACNFENLLPHYGDTFKMYTIPVKNDVVEFSYFSDQNCVLRKTIHLNNSLLYMEMEKRKPYAGKKSEYSIEIRSFTNGEERAVALEEELVEPILTSLLNELQVSLLEHSYRYKEGNKETEEALEKLCAEEVILLLHGTNFEHIPSILEKGLETHYKSICRTTSFIENKVASILSYNYAWNFYQPRNVLFAIEKEKIEKLEATLVGNRDFHKCKSCTSKIMNGFDGWCYQNHYLYELITEKKKEKIILPAKYIYGVLDLNGNLEKNPLYSKEVPYSLETLQKKQKYLEKKLR